MGREGGTHEDFRWGEFFMVGSLTRVWGLPWDDCMRLWAFMREKGRSVESHLGNGVEQRDTHTA